MASRPVRLIRIERVVQKRRCHHTGRISSCILDNPLRKLDILARGLILFRSTKQTKFIENYTSVSTERSYDAISVKGIYLTKINDFM